MLSKLDFTHKLSKLDFMHCVCDWIRVCSHPAMTQGNELMCPCCTFTLIQKRTQTAHTHTHHTYPLIVTDRAERAAFSHHDDSLTRKKNAGRETDWRAERREEGWNDELKDRWWLKIDTFSDGTHSLGPPFTLCLSYQTQKSKASVQWKSTDQYDDTTHLQEGAWDAFWPDVEKV